MVVRASSKFVNLGQRAEERDAGEEVGVLRLGAHGWRKLWHPRTKAAGPAGWFPPAYLGRAAPARMRRHSAAFAGFPQSW